MTVSLLALSLVAAWATIAFLFRRELARAWREPVLVAPVLIVESDDWGYGPPEQAAALAKIAAILAKHRDRNGRCAVMTLGVVLGGPDTELIRAQQCSLYHRLTLASDRLAGVRGAMVDGAKLGAFALQLHGMEHYWPAVLLAAARTDERVRRWLTGAALPCTEALPSPLQSRWTDASVLPSKALADEEIARAVAEEVSAFRSLLASEPEVVVPPTFVWSLPVEQAWARGGARWLVTPGRRHGGRDAEGRPQPAGGPIRNGDRATSGLTYLVRDQYFEPGIGHTTERAVDSLRLKTRCGRPTLLETHRINFIGEEPQTTQAFAELDRMLQAAREACSDLHFMSTADLGRCYDRDSSLIEHRLAPRLHCVVFRLAENTRLRKLAIVSGLAILAALLWSITAATRHGRAIPEITALPRQP